MRLDSRVVQIATEADPSRRIERLLDAARDLFHAEGVALSLVEKGSGSARVVRSRGADLELSGASRPLDQGGTEAVIRAGQPVRRADSKSDRDGAVAATLAPELGRSWVGAPIRDADGVIGVLSAHRSSPGDFSDEDECLLSLLATLVGGALRETTLIEQARNAQQASRDSEQRLRDFAEASSDWFWEQDADLRFTWLSQSVSTTLGLNPSDHDGKTARQTRPVGVDEAYWTRHELDLTARRPFRDFRFGRIDQEGRRRTISVSGKPVVDEHGTFRGYRGVGADITPQVEAEAQAEKAHHSLIDAIESLEDGFLLYDAADRLVLSNRRVLELVPSVADVLKPGVSFEDVVRAAAARGFYHAAHGDLDDIVAERLAQPLLTDGRIEMHVGNGRIVQVKERRTRDGGRLILVTDITELRHATSAIQARVERARTLNHLAQLISSSLDLETVLSEIARAASALLGAPVARFWMVDEQTQTIWLAADASEGSGVDHGPHTLQIADLRGILGWVATTRQHVMIPDAAADPRVRDAAWWAERGLTSFLGQPVLLDGRLLAVLVLWGSGPFAFDADDDALLESFVSQAALSIRNAQLYRDTDQQRRRLQSLVEVSQRLSRGLDLTEVLDAITEAAAAIFEGEAGLRLLVGDELVRASVSRGARQRPSMERITTVGGLIGEVLRTGQPASTPDVANEQRIPNAFREILQQDRMTALLVAPIRHDDRVLGTLHIYRERGHQWQTDAHHLAVGLADQAAAAIENATRYAGLQDSLERARIPARVNQLLSATLDLDVLLREIASAAVKVTGAVVASLWLVNEDARSLHLVVFSDEVIGSGRASKRLAFGEGWAGWVALHRQVLSVDDVFEDDRTTDLDWWRRNGLCSAYSMPVLDGDRLVAVLSINGREPIQLGEDNRELLNALVGQTAAALRNAALYREVSAANRGLEQEVRRNELLLNSVADGVFGVDADGRITFVNPAALRMLGYALGEILGHHADVRLHHPDGVSLDPGRPACSFELALRRGQAYRSSDDVLWKRDGDRIPVECVLTPLLQDGTSTGAVVTFRDISREKEAERQRRMLAQSEKLRALGQLAGGVAHDLNQSLGLVVGHSELALDTIRQLAVGSEELRESLETIMQGALDGAQTVKRLQTFVRGQPEGEAERISVGSLLSDVVRLTAPRWRDAAQAAGAPVSVRVNVAVSGGDEILGWPASLREALINLVFNALDAMPTGGDLQLTASGTPSQIVVEVADTGSGMPPDVAARVFEPFFTTKGERGTGLGLAMVYGIVERHAGRIDVDSKVRRGTTLRITLPRAPGYAEAALAAGAKAATRARTILIVDDEEALRRMLTRMLEIDGHTVVAAATADEALEQLSRQRFDVVLSDHGLGLGMNGLELATAIRERWPGTRFILVTGWGGSIDSDEVRPLGVEAVIAKPYRAPELRAQIDARP